MEGELSEMVLEEGAVIEEEAEIDGEVYLGRGAWIKKGAHLIGPVWVGENTVILGVSHISPHTVSEVLYRSPGQTGTGSDPLES